MRRHAAVVTVAAVVLGVGLPAAWAVATTGRQASAPLPTLPPVAEEIPGLYDEQGCLRTGLREGDVDCSVRAEELDAALIDGGPSQERHLAGFVGPQYLAESRGTGPVVLDETVRQRRSGGAWTAQGLARNEGDGVVASIEVTARLLDRSGAVLAEVQTTSPVRDVRPGEPVPFQLVADLPASAVGAVEWSAAGAVGGDDRRRDLAWTVWWERPAGRRAPVDLYLHHERGPGPQPRAVFGSVEHVGEEAVAAPEVVMAWLDARGRVAALATAPVSDPDGRPLATLAPGEAADVLVSLDRPVPSASSPLVWVQGR